MTQQSHIHADGHVLAAVDASVYTESVCRHAAWAASRLAAPLEFVHVMDPVKQTAPVDLAGNLILGERETLLRELSSLDEQRARLAQDRGRLLLMQAQQLAAAAGDHAEVRLRHGGLLDTLLELEDSVRLFVVGKRGEKADFARGHLGGEVERLVRALHRPLLVASREFRPIRRVLLAYDGSPTTQKAVAIVGESPLFRGLDISVVTVGQGDKARSGLDSAVQRLSDAGLAATGRMVEGPPDEAIATCVREDGMDLLVMGAYGHSRIRELIVGSTTNAMLRSCRIPVLLVR